jgi:hypothetical protein
VILAVQPFTSRALKGNRTEDVEGSSGRDDPDLLPADGALNACEGGNGSKSADHGNALGLRNVLTR